MKVLLIRFFVFILLAHFTIYTVNGKGLNPTPPISHGEYSSGVLAPGHVITFDGSGSYDTDLDSYGITPKWRWDFDYDGSFDPGSWTTTPQTTHIFSSSRTYTIAVQYMDNEGQTGMPDFFQVTITQKRRYYYIKDLLGSIRTTVDEDGYVVGYDDYYPFGLTMPGRSSNSANPNDDYKFTGHELDDEAGLDIYHMNARGMDPVLGRMMQIDPLVGMFPGWSPYSYTFNNPMGYTDPTGMAPLSTHTDSLGNVVAVYDDGDTGVYSHNKSSGEIRKDTQGCQSAGNTSCGGTRQGETEYWDEFALHDNYTGEIIYNEDGTVAAGGRIYYGTSWDGVIAGMNELAVGLGGSKSASLSTGGELFDIKASAELSPSGAGTGRLLNGKYASARSAGNYLAGMNGATVSQYGYTLRRIDFLKIAGAVHQGEYKGRNTVINAVLFGTSFGPSPYYGEIPYAGRMIVRGFNHGLRKK